MDAYKEAQVDLQARLEVYSLVFAEDITFDDDSDIKAVYAENDRARFTLTETLIGLEFEVFSFAEQYHFAMSVSQDGYIYVTSLFEAKGNKAYDEAKSAGLAATGDAIDALAERDAFVETLNLDGDPKEPMFGGSPIERYFTARALIDEADDQFEESMIREREILEELVRETCLEPYISKCYSEVKAGFLDELEVYLTSHSDKTGLDPRS
ncbi:hypothetical protein COV18_06000 [Candidatus Woesearchaeota archaeon CG10_big_fil_rev_8_21_14_0_10_37_12]|nr:MAG: hypothetical protein COV18_06000 [Candidatus Woesearchaeota archaeon CG10_big_fil_rev_8_21_14_0_10_37_12]